MFTSLEQQEQSLRRQIAQQRGKVAELLVKRNGFDKELAELEVQGQNFRALGNICSALDTLSQSGASALFWGDEGSGIDQERVLQRVRTTVNAFESKVSDVQSRRATVQTGINAQTATLLALTDELDELLEEIEEAKNAYAIERELEPVPFRAMVMPWSYDGEDERRFRKILLIILLLTIFLGWVVPLLKKPVDRSKPIVVPERIAQLVKKREEPPPQPKKEKKEEEEKPKDEKQQPKEEKAKPTPTQEARTKAETKGILAFKSSMSDLMDDATPMKMGAEARLTNAGPVAAGSNTRSMILSQAGGSSGGINVAEMSRNGGGGGGRNITGSGVSFTRVESSTGAAVADARPLSKGLGPSRTDEEIQIVFDRYKSALYRIYNRELRNNPGLAGKMVLRLTIEPDGRVSACVVKSTDLDSPALSAEIVERVLKFNFGPKEGVPPVTVNYPIDFLPAG